MLGQILSLVYLFFDQIFPFFPSTLYLQHILILDPNTRPSNPRVNAVCLNVIFEHILT